MLTRRLDTGAIDVAGTLAATVVLPRDPTVALGPQGYERATWTPDGPASLRIEFGDDAVEATCWGEGAAWVADRIGDLVGLADDIDTFAPADGPVGDAWRRRTRLRIPATRTLWHDAAWMIVQQRVTTQDAAEQWRPGRRVRRRCSRARRRSAPTGSDAVGPRALQRAASVGDRTTTGRVSAGGGLAGRSPAPLGR